MPLYTEDGPDIKTLEHKLAEPVRLFYTMPAVHNPTGIAYSRDKKVRIVKKARKRNFFIVEDDYLSEFHPDAGPRFVDLLPEKTIYVKSLSQTTVSGIRLGFMLVPADLYDKFLYAKYSSDIACAGILQKFVREFIKNGAYREYLKSIRTKISERKDLLLSILKRHPGLVLTGPQHGYSLWVEARQKPRLDNAPWHGGNEFSFSPAFRNCFRISYMCLDDLTFPPAVVYLGKLLSQAAETS